MKNFRWAVMWIGLTLIILLIFLSIYGAFLGAQRAKTFFNSLPLAVYWIALALLLITGIAVFHRLVCVPGLLLMHLGCIFTLAGSIWASQAGHKLHRRLFGIDKIPAGQMKIYEGCLENRVLLENGEPIKELPFYIRLKNFRIEYYKPEYLLIQTRQGKSWRIPVEIGKESPLGNDFGTVKILKAFENFKIRIEGDEHIPYDDPQPGFNPALQVQIKSPDGDVTTRYIFERFPSHIHPEDKLLLSYQRVISDYVSRLQIIENNKIVAEKNIEVNHPLAFGGYHFYQHSYDAQAGQYTVLAVVSDSGLDFVYAGYLMLCGGVFWHFGLRYIFTAAKVKNKWKLNTQFKAY